MNNLKELFEIQGGLDSEINKKHPKQEGEDRLEKKHTALLVELGEMMNENRAMKFWSNDQEPRTNVICRVCEGDGEFYYPTHGSETCPECKGTGKCDYQLKELVDCLHFILGIGLEMAEIHPMSIDMIVEGVKPINYEQDTIEGAFIRLIGLDWTADDYEEGLDLFIGFCQKLDYTWEQVTAAYLEKNHENHMRLLNGY